ncbi:MAG: winged helix-turn-helix domain-containing protein [Candidatus Nezhaarchaeota archaeon]|nr:winged helix-turn-helix domain-containing protein [Candidatus Nezhaarchaeota archaeon]
MLMAEGREETAISGTTLRVYIYMLKSAKPVGVREVQRAMGFRSPSTASYHISKLVEHGLAARDGDGYKALSNSSLAPLLMFQRVGRIMVPRLLFYAVFFTAATAFFLALCPLDRLMLFPENFTLMLCLLASAFMWAEAVRLWRRGLT